jgi:hypothetical protein
MYIPRTTGKKDKTSGSLTRLGQLDDGMDKPEKPKSIFADSDYAIFQSDTMIVGRLPDHIEQKLEELRRRRSAQLKKEMMRKEGGSHGR